MSNSNKTYRINTKVGADNNDNINLNLNVLQKYDILEVLSLKLSTDGIYKTHTSGYGCIAGRVLANGGVGVPNAKISIFIESNENISTEEILYNLYPYKTTRDKNDDHIRYNLLPDEKVSDCHQIIGTFPTKRLVLDDKNVLEVFEKYYKFTTVTNESGDYMLFGIPTGNQTLHMDLDLSDIGFLSQKPVDMKYKGYNNTLFENPKQFKTDTNIDNLVQVISQSSPVYIKPFWGEEDGEEIGITRHDIDVNYKFEPTCVFMGSMVSDANDNGFSKKCIPSRNMGRMEKLTAGHGTIEMIRKKHDGSVEEFPIMGNELIDENGVWCYQIPMNLDYIITDEYGNLVPTDNPEKGLPTRTRVRFRLSKSDNESNSNNNHLAKVLIPNNPQDPKNIDYTFGSMSEDNDEGALSFRDLFWNNVYTVKSFIPRIQKGNNQRTEKFSGIKKVNINNGNNPIPYNNMRVNITFMFTLQCAIIKSLIFFIKTYNWLIGFSVFKRKKMRCAYIGDGLCPDLEGWYFAPMCGQRDSDDDKDKGWRSAQRENTLDEILEKDGGNLGKIDENSIDSQNSEDENVCLTTNIDYFMQCLEINLALENDVIQFDFYNDWINGLIYLPRWYVDVKKKRSFLFGLIRREAKIHACSEEYFKNTRRYVQQCALGYSIDNSNNIRVTSKDGCHDKKNKHKCHKKSGRKYVKIFGNKGGIVHREMTLKKDNVYYLKPCEVIGNNKKCNLYSTDIVLLGNINKCNIHGIPSEFNEMSSSTYQLPPVLVQTNMDSDGVLYSIKGEGVSRCTKNTTKNGIEPVEQSFSSYEKWSNNSEKRDDETEYAVTEISGIDWGLNGPNQGKNDGIYTPGGHFLGISCSNAQVNIKSCVNLSRICEIGVIMSQRQAIPSYGIDENGNKILTYDYLIPSGFISKDEISENNFRNILATLNYNGLKTITNEYGLKEYNFVSVQPINFSGDLKDYVNNKKYNDVSKADNPNYDTRENAFAHVRTMEYSSKDYNSFRFGINNEKTSLKNKFLLKENGKYYLPTYENSYYFYYGIKNGATALDKFLSDYFSECPTRGESIVPEIGVSVEDKIICSEDSKVTIEIKNVPIPFNYKITKDNEVVCGITDFTLNKFEIVGLDKGEYNVEIENYKSGIILSKKFKINEILPTSPEGHNFYDNSCNIITKNFDTTPRIVYNEDKNNFTITPTDNGGIVLLTLPNLNTNSNLEPYIYGFAVTCNGYCVCFSYSTKAGADKRAYEVLCRDVKYEFTWLKKTINRVNDEETLYNVSDNALNIFIDGDFAKVAFKGWEYNMDYNFYVCYSCNTLFNNIKLMLIDNGYIGVDNNKMTYYMYNENVTLSEIDINSPGDIFEKIEENNERIVKFNYNNLGNLTPYEEWSIKRALYFDDSYYNGGTGSIVYGVIGGTAPYEERIVGTSELPRDDGSLQMVDGVDSSIDGSIFPISTNDFEVPTIMWIDNLSDENGNIYQKTPYNITIKDVKGVVPYIGLKNGFECGNTENETPPNPWLDINKNNDTEVSGIELTSLLE